MADAVPTPDQATRGGENFSLVLGGPLFQLLRRAHLSDDALTLAKKRVVVIALFAWLPLLLLAALQGQARARLARVVRRDRSRCLGGGAAARRGAAR